MEGLGAEALAKVPTSLACFLPDGHAPKFGEVFRNPGLARSLRAIARDGRDAFYQGGAGRGDRRLLRSRSAACSSTKDFEDHTSTWVEPVSTNYRGYDVWELPPNGQGIAALQMLNLLEPYDLKAMGPQSAEALHLMIEAKKLAYEDRAKYYTDPEFAQVPVAELISKAYAARRGKLIDPDHANDQPDRRRAEGGGHDLPDGRRQGRQRREPDREQLRGVRLGPRRRATSGSRSRTEAACSPSTRTTPTASSRASGRSTRSSPASSPRTASPGSRSA